MTFPDRRAASRDEDQALLDALLACPDLTEEEEEAFRDMRTKLVRHLLTNKQRDWAAATARKLNVYLDFMNANVPRSRGSAWTNPPDVLKRPLPKLPPGRRA